MTQTDTQSPATHTPVILELEGLTKSFVTTPGIGGHIANLFGAGIKRQEVRAVSGVDLTVKTGEIVGIVGESGCGKSTVARMLAGISSPTGGEIRYRGKARSQMTHAEREDFALSIQMIFQDPYASLNPRMRVRDIIGEAAVVHGYVTRAEMAEYVEDLMNRVGLAPDMADRFPHQFSGGQRQRIGIARALALKPDVLICDESVAALDVSIQAQVLNLFMDLRDSLGLTYLFISHNLGVVEHISDRVVIMYLGRVVESAPTEELYARPHHPYTRLLMDHLPTLSVEHRQHRPIAGDLPSPLDPPPGCPFNPRCPMATDRCRTERPELRQISPDHISACHFDVTDAATPAQGA